MPLFFSVAMRDAGLDGMVTAIGSAATLKLMTGSLPANLAAAETGVPLVTYPLSTSWGTQAATSGVKNLANVPIVGATTGLGGTVGYFRVYDGSGTPHMQGSVTAVGGGGDLQMNNVIIAGQPVSVTTWTLTDGNNS